MIAPYGVAPVLSIADQRGLNTASQDVQGIDLQWDHSQPGGGASIDLYESGTYLQLPQQAVSSAPVQEIAGAAFCPPTFRAQIGTTAAVWGWSAAPSIHPPLYDSLNTSPIGRVVSLQAI